MRTTINVDDAVFADVIEFTNSATKTEAVNRALTDYVRFRKKELLLSLPGKIKVETDWRKLRESRKHG